MFKTLLKVLLTVYLTLGLSFAEYLSLDGNQWNAINQNQCKHSITIL